MPLPNREITDASYRYKFQGQEKDTETGMEAFELRLWDGRLGRWQSPDPYGEFQSSYLGMGNNPVSAIDPDGGDIIFLFASKAVFGLGHAAVLIGSDKDGWRYVSVNGTGEGIPLPYGDSENIDLGDTRYDYEKNEGNDFRGTGLTAEQVMVIVNTSNKNETQHYDKFIRIKTSPKEDNIAYRAAIKQAKTKTYNLFGCSCIDPPQETFKSVVTSRQNGELKKDFKYGFKLLIPNDVYKHFDANMAKINNDLLNINSQIFKFISGDITGDYEWISRSPRDF